jgi:hypothetical protein
MDILNLTEEFITKKCDEVYKRRRQLNGMAWWCGWNDAINFAKEISEAYAICEQCGKIITEEWDYTTDNQGIPFCVYCYDKLFNAGAYESNRK